MAKKQLKRPIKKVDREAKIGDPKPKTGEDETYRCTCCGHKYARQEGYFNVSKSPIYQGNNGYMSICKQCIVKLYNQFVEFYDKDEDAAAERICQITDTYFSELVWASSRGTTNNADRNRFSAYVSKLNLNQNKGATYSDTLADMWEVAEKEEKGQPVHDEEREIDPDVLRRFGLGFADEEYDVMQYEYEDWVKRYGDPEDKRQEELYVTMCYLKLNLQKNLRADSGGNMGSISNSYKGFIEAATTEIEERKRKEKEEVQLLPLGVLARDMEQYVPAEYYKNKKLYNDFDSLQKYHISNVFRPLKNLFTGTKEMDEEYSLSESEG